MRSYASILVALCITASMATAQDKTALTAAKRVACGADGDTFEAKRGSLNVTAPGTAEAGKALLYVLSDEPVCLGCGITLKIGVDGSWVGATKGASWISLQLSPGEHHVCSAWQSRLDSLSQMAQLTQFTAEVGKVYFLRAHVVPPTDRAFPDLTLSPVGTDEGLLLLLSSPQAQWKKH